MGSMGLRVCGAVAAPNAVHCRSHYCSGAAVRHDPVFVSVVCCVPDRLSGCGEPCRLEWDTLGDMPCCGGCRDEAAVPRH